MDKQKNYKGCNNCEHQPAPLTTCAHLRGLDTVVLNCPMWKKREETKNV
jgi:hypothetical protein